MPNHSIEHQKKRILDRLRVGPVTSCELTREMDILRPASRIFDLRSDGHEIVMHWTYDRINGTDHRVGRYVLMKEGQKIESPDSAPHRIEAKQKKAPHQSTAITKEIAGTVVVGVLFAVIAWASVIGMSGGFTSETGLVLAEVATDGR